MQYGLTRPWLTCDRLEQTSTQCICVEVVPSAFVQKNYPVQVCKGALQDIASVEIEWAHTCPQGVRAWGRGVETVVSHMHLT
mmetsp:Transcript_64656/g.108390  ORF Transcript_64656/g.108390 Transcript_64656/m.108390 type:complete len:82 (-) Transcript_64656:185-430(-)